MRSADFGPESPTDLRVLIGGLSNDISFLTDGSSTGCSTVSVNGAIWPRAGGYIT